VIIRNWRFAALVGMAFMLLSAVVAPAIAQGTQNVLALLQNWERLYSEKNYRAASEAALEVLAALELQFGRDSRQVGRMLNEMATLYRLQRRFDEAEAAYKRAIGLYGRALGPRNIPLGNTLDNLASLYDDEGRYKEAEPIYKQSLEINESILGAENLTVATTLNNLATLYNHQGRFSEAEPLFRHSLAITEREHGPDHPDVAVIVHNLGMVYLGLRRFDEAERYLARELALDEKRLGPKNLDLTHVLERLAKLFVTQGQYAKAEPLYRRCLEIDEAAFGLYHPDVAHALKNLGSLYQKEGRDDAELILKRSLSIYEKLGSDRPEIAEVADLLAEIYMDLGKHHDRYPEAEPLLKRSLAIHRERSGLGSIEVGRALNNLALLYGRWNGHFAEAERLYGESMAIHEKLVVAHPEYSLEYAAMLNNIALLYHTQGKFDKAEPIYRRALSLYEQNGKSDPRFIDSLHNLAMLSAAMGNWKQAADLWQRATGLIIHRTEMNGQELGEPLVGRSETEAQQLKYMFHGLIKARYRQLEQTNGIDAGANQTFLAAQWIFASPAAQSLAQTSVRGASGGPKIAALVRERQDLVVEWQQRDRVRSAALAETPDKLAREANASNVARLASIDDRVRAIDGRIRTEFRPYAAFENPEPLSVADVQKQLHDGEALMMVLDSQGWFEETFVWVVTKADVRWRRVDIGTAGLDRDVTALRCGLAYDRKAWATGGRCVGLFQVGYDPDDGGPLPFDLVRAHRLYAALFGQFEDLVAGKELLLVLSGPLTQLPFHVLVTKPPLAAFPESFAGYRDVAWLVRDNAVTVLPAVASIKSLREFGRPSRAEDTYIGFGNPLLDGDAARYPNDAILAQHAREASCRPPAPRLAAWSWRAWRRPPALQDSGARAGAVDRIRSWQPLPETADELCNVARDLGADPAQHVYLGARATASEIKELSVNGSLARFRIVHFATHGIVAGALSAKSEPGLVLTPSSDAGASDDGFLPASEIANLKLEADWVILSACNTAAGDAKGAEALSGLARAFFYAGARSILVSHWAINSKSTVKLVTGAVGELGRHHAVGPAEALRRSMLALMTDGRPYEAHPAFWAPFVVVGEGAAQGM